MCIDTTYSPYKCYLTYFLDPKPLNKSIGRGNMMVEFFSAEMELRVCRYRSCKAAGDWDMMSAASLRARAAFCSPSAAITWNDIGKRGKTLELKSNDTVLANQGWKKHTFSRKTVTFPTNCPLCAFLYVKIIISLPMVKFSRKKLPRLHISPTLASCFR